MYNVDYLPQLEKFRRDLFGGRTPEEIADAERRYCPPPSVKIVDCVEDTNGEWVPKDSLEGKGEHGC